MTVLSPQQIVGLALPSLAPASSSEPAGPGLGGAIHDTWQRSDAQKVKLKKERSAAVARAKAKAEARSETKAERLARQQGPARITGSDAERRETRSSVAKAAERVAAEHPDIDLSAPEVRTAIEKLRQRYPGRSIGEIVAAAEKLDAAMKEDPVSGRDTLLEHFSALLPDLFAEFKAPTYKPGLRGSLQRARQDQEDAASLKDAQAKYGANLPHILQQLERFDSSLRADPAGASARIAVSQGAPATARQVPAYEAVQAAKAQKRHAEAAYASRLRGVQLAIEHGYIPGDEDHLEEVAAVLQSPKFQPHPTDGLDTLVRASRIAAHPDHKRITPRKGKSAGNSGKRDPGALSISGGPGAGQGGRSRGERGTGGIRDSIARVRAAM